MNCIFLRGIVLSLFAVLSLCAIANAADLIPSVAWNKTFPDTIIDRAQAVIQTSDGGFILTCAPSSMGTFYTLKLDAVGNPQWNRTFFGTVLGLGQTIIQTADGGYAVAGGYQGSPLLLRIDPLGVPQWNKTYVGPGICSAAAIIQTREGGYALVGTSIKQSEPSGVDTHSTWFIKTDSQGNMEWNQTLGSGDPRSLIQTADGGYAVAKDYYFNLVKLDSKGIMEWNRTYVDRDKNEVHSLVQASDGGYALGGWMWLRINEGSPYFALVKTDETGSAQWTKYYGEGTAWSMAKTIDDGFAMVGSNNRFVKTDANGTKQWEIDVGGYCVIQTRDGGYAVTGSAPINETASGARLAKLSRDPVLPSATPPSSMSASASPSPSIPEFTPVVILGLAVATGLLAIGLRKSRVPSAGK
jgi:hypothetical protein